MCEVRFKVINIYHIIILWMHSDPYLGHIGN